MLGKAEDSFLIVRIESGEIGRLPIIETQKPIGRDHNPDGFSMWFAGGGIKARQVHGKTDILGLRAIHDYVIHFDYHATLLHLFGLNHHELLFDQSTRHKRLTDGQRRLSTRY